MFTIACGLLCIAAAGTSTTTATHEVLDHNGGRGLRVIVIPIEGTIDLGLAPLVRRGLESAQGAAAVILDVDTFGGRVDAAVIIRDAILDSKVPVVAFINRRAISAGALISLAADQIIVTSGATMGAATPIQVEGGTAKPVGEKMVSYMRSEMRSTAEAKGRRGDLAEAMVDAELEVKDVSPKGKLLTLTTEVALATGMANGQVETQVELLKLLGLEHAEVVRIEANWAETLARFVTDPVVSGLLMSLGFLALMVELYSPGFGVGGTIGVVLLGAFFGGHMIVELAGWEEVLLFAAGLIALGAEVFVIPGFGVAGALGIVLVVSSLVLALTGHPVSTAWNVGAIGGAFGQVMLALVGGVIGMIFVARKLPESTFGRWMVLDTTLGRSKKPTGDGDDEFVAQPTSWDRYVGKTGIAASDLRPAGKATIENDLVDVVSRGDYIDKGTRIRIVEVEGVRIVAVRDQEES